MKFPDILLNAIGAWQKGWREQQDLRLSLAVTLLEETRYLNDKYREVNIPCYRKRFLLHGELVSLILDDHLDEGVVSWTTRLEFAEEFKGIVRPDALTGAVFQHMPEPSEVVVSLHALWSDEEFVAAVEDYRRRDAEHAHALSHFKDEQGEIILTAPLRGTEIIRVSGTPSFFDDLCDKAGIASDQRDQVWKTLILSDKDPTMPRYTTTEGAQRVIANTIKKIHDRIAAAKSRISDEDQSGSE
jgi:hypothetical protein